MAMVSRLRTSSKRWRRGRISLILAMKDGRPVSQFTQIEYNFYLNREILIMA
jgi:hypothetical protein